MQQKVGPAAIAIIVVIVVALVGIWGWKYFSNPGGKSVGAGQSSGNADYDAYNKDINNGPKMGGGGNYTYKRDNMRMGSPTPTRPPTK